jgi:hypothetical protein
VRETDAVSAEGPKGSTVVQTGPRLLQHFKCCQISFFPVSNNVGTKSDKNIVATSGIVEKSEK